MTGQFDFEAEWFALASEEPITWNVDDGMSDHCWYCHADEQHKQVPRMLPDGRHAHPTHTETAYFAEHDPYCPWVRARLHFDLPLGHHTIAPTKETETNG